MATSIVSDWDEIEADSEFSSLPRDLQVGIFNDWEKKFNRTLLEGADLDKVKPEGLNRFAATNAVRRRKLAGEDVSDPNAAVKSWSEQKQAEAKLAQQALKDYADVEDKQFRVRDADSRITAAGLNETYVGEGRAMLDSSKSTAQKNLEAAEAKFTPEVRAQAQAASEALKGKRKIATLNGNIYTDPALVLDKDEFRKQVLDSDAPPEAKVLKLASFQNEKKRYLDEAINTLTKGDPQIPLAESFPKFLESKGFDLDQEMVKQSEGRLEHSPIQKQRELAQEYLTKMQDRGWFRKIGSAISTGVATGMLDIGTQAVGTAAMLTGDEEKSKVAAELSRASGDIGAAQGLEGDMQATGGTFAGGVSRLGTNMAPMLLPGGSVGGIARLAGAGAGAATAAAVGASALTAGAQTAGSQFGEVYDHLRQQGKTHEQAFGVSRNAAVLSGAVTTALTALGGATGVESLLRRGGKDLVKSRLVAALKAVPGGAAAEIAEELPDEYVSQLVSAFAKDPNASPSQVTDEFAANAPDLILQIAALGGVGSGVGRFKETTTDPAKAAQEQEFPAAGAPPDLSQQDRDNFAKGGVPIFDTEGNVTGYTVPRAAEATASTEDIRKAAEEAIKPGVPVEVNGVTIATIPPESDMTPEDVLDFANSPEDMAMLARNGKITLPEVVAPIEGVDPAITDEMNERLAASAAIAPQTVEALKAAPEVDIPADIPEAQIAPTVGETAAPEVGISEESLQREWQKLEDRALAAIEFGATDRVPAIRDEQARISKRLLDARMKEAKPAETLGVTPPPAPALEAPEGAARNAEMLRQAAARAAGTEQGPPIGFTNPSVKLDLTSEESSATGAGMKEENQQTSRDTSKAERLKYLKSREVNTSGGTSLSDAEDEELAELTGQFPPTYRDPSKPEQMLPREVEKAAVEKKLSEGVGARLKGANKKSYVLGVEAGARREHRSAIADAFDDNKPVSTEAVDTYGIELPEEYARQGELYIFQPSSEKSDLGAGAATTPAKGPLKVTTPKAGKPTELELKAAAIGDDPAALKKRLNEAKSVLSNLAKKKMGAGKLDHENKRLIADDGSFALQWRVRRNPSEPISYENQQTSIGVVFATPVEKQVSPVTTATETPSSTANAAGGSQSVQTEPAEGSIPAVTEDTVSISDIPSTPVTPQGEAPTTATEGQPMPGGSSEWSPTVGQPATATINSQKIVGTVGPSTGKGLVSFQYVWNGKPQKATVRPDRLESPVASLTDPPKYQYTQEQNTRKMGKHFPVALGVHANHDFRKSFASMAEDTSLSRSYRQIAKVLSEMPAFANVDFHVIADGRKTYAGEYSFFDGKAAILVNLRQVGRGKVDALGTILHEALHHVTLAKVLDPQGDFEIEVVGKLDKIRERVAEYAKQQGISEKAIGYEIGTLEEFISALTRPDFQRFLASIPDSFAPDVAVGKYRSVLSEVFRHIAELLFKKPVPKGSTLEQYTTTILALFETPHRTIPLKPLSYLRAQSKPGYRTPAEMLAEAAEKAKGERATEKPQGLASMFKPQAKRPATGERKLLDMPKVAGSVYYDPAMPFITALVHKSARGGGAWQGTIMGPEGPTQHIEGDSREAIVQALERSGFVPKAINSTQTDSKLIADAYREAVRGSSTQMAPLSTVYAQARLLQPGLTPEAFLAQVQEGYDNGTLLLEGEVAGAKPQGLASMFNPQAKRPATGERKLLDMPKKPVEPPARINVRRSKKTIGTANGPVVVGKFSDDLTDTNAANGKDAGSVLGTVDIADLTGMLRLNQPEERRRVDALKSKILSEEGYVSPIVVSAQGEVIEGQHRLAAMRELGATEMPVAVSYEASDFIPDVDALKKALAGFSLRQQQVDQLVGNLAEMLKDEKGDAKELSSYDMPKPFEDVFKAAVAEVQRQLGVAAPKTANLADAYREAVRGSSTQMAPLSSVYAQARLLQPGLTPEAFLAQVQESYDNGTLLLEGAGSQQEAAQAGLALPGTPVGTAVRMMPAPETPKSLVDEETDAAYLAAVEAGDTEKAQRMVDEAAKAAMPNSVVHERMMSSKERSQDKLLLKVYHGTDQVFNTFESGRPSADDWGFFGTIETNRHGMFFAENKTFAETYAKARGGNRVVSAFLNITNPFQFTDAQDILESRELGEEMTPDFHMARWLMSLKHQWEAFDGREGVDFTNWLREKGYDGAFIQEDGHGLVDPDETQDVWVALSPSQIKSADPVTYDDQGNVIPLSQRFNPESNSILYAAPINTTQSNEQPGDGREDMRPQNVPPSTAAGGTRLTPTEGGVYPMSVLARLDAAREAAVSAAVAESDWGNYTPEQKTEALNSFIRSTYAAADYSSWAQLRDVGGLVLTRGGKGSASVRSSVGADGRLNLELTYDNTERSLPGVMGGIPAREMFAFSYDTAQEEIIHAADKIGAFQRWKDAGRPSTFVEFERDEAKATVTQLNQTRLSLQESDPAASQKIKEAMLASWNIYHADDQVPGINGLLNRLDQTKNDPVLYLYELRRQLTQLKRQDFTTETGWQKFRRVLEKWLTDAINSLRGVQDVFRSGMAGDLIQRQLADLEAALEGKPLPPVSRGTPKSMAEEPPTIDIGGEAEPADGKGKQLYQKESDQRESDKVLGVMMEDGRFEEGVKMYDKAKRANLGAPPQPSPNTSTPPRFTSPAQFAAAFEAAFLRGDYDYFLEALKQADRHIYVPEMKRYINASKLGDTDAAERLEWFRHAIAGTVPANVKPQTASAPPPAAVGSPTTPPPPTVTPPPKAGASNRPMLTLNTPAMGLIAKMLGTSIRINTLLRRARGRIKLSMADGSEIELSKHLFKDLVQAAKTLAHEIGHLFDFLPASGFTKTLAHKLAPLGDFRKVFGDDLADWFMDGGKKIKPSKITQLIKPELIALSKKWRGDFGPSDKYRGSGKELYADFISAILNDPMWAAKNAPYTTLGFLNALEQKPEVEQAYQLLVSLVQGGSLYKALAEADQGRSTTALERLIAKSSALMRTKKTLNDAARGLYRSMFGKWLPTAIRDGGIWKSYWNRLKGIGTSKDYNWAQEEASQFAVRQITRFDNDLANVVGIPLKLAGIDPDYLQRLQTNNRIIHERRRVGKLIEEDPVKARALLKWMVDAGLLGKDVQAEVDSAADEDLYALTAKVIGMMHADGYSFERALKAARRKGAPADAEKALYAFDVSGFMLNPKVLTMESAEADNADIEQTLGPDQFAELQRINDGYHDLVRRTMVDAYKLGLFRKSTWDDVIEPNFGAYVPFTPIKYFTGHVKGGLGPARVGTAHDLMAPHVVGTLKMHALIRRMQQQKQALLLLDFFNNTGLSKELEPVEDEDFDRIKAEELTKQSKHTISYVPYWDEGEYKWVKVNGTDAVTLMQNSDPDDLAALYKVLRSNTQMWRLNYTIFSIAFNVANTLRNIATPFVDIGPKAGYKAAKQLLSVFPQMAKWVWARIAGKDPASVIAASIAVEHALHKPGMPVSKELQEFYDRNILQPMPDVAALRMSQEELARSVMGAMSSPEFLLQGVHKAAKDMKWYDNTLKQYLHSAVDVMSFIGSVSEAAPKIAAYQALKEKKDSKGKPAFTDAQATYLATLEGIPRPGVAGAHNAALEMVLMFFRVAVQSWRKHLVMATAPQTRAGFLMRHMLFESAKFGLQAMAANGAIDYLIALGAAAMAGGDDDDPEKFKQVDWAEAMDRQSSYKLSHGGIGPLLGWVLPDGSVEPPWGHKSIPADWVPIMPRLPGTELSREADPLAYYATSKMLAPEIAPVNDDVFWNDFVRSVIPSLNPTFEVASDAMSVLGPTPPRDSYRGREKVEQRIWDEGYVARILGLGEHHLKSFGIGSNAYDTPLPGVWNVLKRPGIKTILASDNMVGVRDEQRARHEDDLTSSFAQNMVGEKFNTLKKTFNRLKGKTTPRTKQEEREYKMLKPVMSKVFYGTEKRDGKYDVLQSYARLKAKGLQDTPGGKLLKAEAEQATKDLEKIADDLQKPLEFIRTHTLP